ncbi:type IV pilus biogenesis protein PilP, partial [Enterobacter intestinihominis]
QSTNQQVSQPAEVTKGQLEQLHIRNIILQAEVQGAQLQRQLEENQAGAGTVAPSLPGAIVGETSLPGQPARTVPANNRPVVLEINGRDQKLRATLQLPSGQSLV